MTGPRRLGIVLASADPGDLGTATSIALAARRAGLDVALFAMDRGALALAADGDAIAALLAADCALTVCATSIDAAATGRVAVPPGIVIGSQDDHAALVATSDRVVALT